ncbi:MAG: hypothetical protein L6R28_15390 [Planctomycetes bacterium]|nr:hypothetical protein [Planctomycetota bacterium]
MKPLPVEKLSPDDFAKHPVWEFCNDEEGVKGRDETWVRPVKKLPVDSIDNCVAGIQVTLSDGSRLWALIGNVDPQSQKSTDEFVTLSFFLGRTKFHLSRYFDADVARFGPDQLANALSKKLDEIFPIRWDMSHVFSPKCKCVSGEVFAKPKKKLTRSARMRLIFEK